MWLFAVIISRFKICQFIKINQKSNRNQQPVLSDKDQFQFSMVENSLLTPFFFVSVRDKLPRHIAQHLGVGVQHVAHLLRGAALRVPAAPPETPARPPHLRGCRGPSSRRPRWPRDLGGRSPQPGPPSVSRPRPLQPGRPERGLPSPGRGHDGARGRYAWSSLPLLL